MTMRTICFGLAVLFAGTVKGELISFGDWTTAQLRYSPHPHTVGGDPFPAVLSFQADDQLRTFNLHQLDIYDDTRTSIAYSFAPQSLMMTPITNGRLEALFNESGYPMRARFRPRGVAPGANWQLTISPVDEGPQINQSMFELYPWITRFEVSTVSVAVPEPLAATLWLSAVASIAALRRGRNTVHKLCLA
jgi:hypothetical protein